METPTALFIVGIALIALLNKRRISLTLFGFAIFFRMELIILLLLILAYVILKNLFSWFDITIFISAGLIPFVIFDLYYFNTIVPHAILAKSTVYSLSHLDTLITLLGITKRSPMLPNYYPKLSLMYLIYIVYIQIIIFGIYILNILKHRKSGLKFNFEIPVIITLWGFITIIGYIVSRSKIFNWYIPLYVIPIFFGGAYAIINTVPQKIYRLLIIIAFPLLLLQLISLGEVFISTTYNPAYFINFSEGARVKQYINIGKELFKLHPNANLMTSEIGGLGYGFKGKIIDAGGLASNRALKYHPLNITEKQSSGGLGAIPPDFVIDIEPDIIVSYDIFIEALLQNDVINHYEVNSYPLFLNEDREKSIIRIPMGRYIRNLWNIQSLYVFIHQDLGKYTQ